MNSTGRAARTASKKDNPYSELLRLYSSGELTLEYYAKMMRASSSNYG